MQRGIVYCILAALLLIVGSFQPKQSAIAQDMVPVAYIPIVRGMDQQPIRNGGFEMGTNGWNDRSKFNVPQIINISSFFTEYPNSAPPAHSGDWLAWLGGIVNEVGSVSQQVYIPPGQTHLTFWQIAVSGLPCTTGFDRAEIVVDNSTRYHYPLCYERSNFNWQQVSVDLSSYSNNYVLIAFTINNYYSDLSHLFIDDVTLTADPIGSNWIKYPYTPDFTP